MFGRCRDVELVRIGVKMSSEGADFDLTMNGRFDELLTGTERDEIRGIGVRLVKALARAVARQTGMPADTARTLGSWRRA